MSEKQVAWMLDIQSEFVLGWRHRGSEALQVQVPRPSEDLREQEPRIHQVDQGAVRRDEGRWSSPERRSQREILPRARPPVQVVQDPGRSGRSRVLEEGNRFCQHLNHDQFLLLRINSYNKCRRFHYYVYRNNGVECRQMLNGIAISILASLIDTSHTKLQLCRLLLFL